MRNNTSRTTQPPASSFLLYTRPLPPVQLPRMRRRLLTRPPPPPLRMRAGAPSSRFSSRRLTFWQRGGACAVCPGVPSKCHGSLFGEELLLVAVPLKNKTGEDGQARAGLSLPSRAAGPPQRTEASCPAYTSQRQAVMGGGRQHYLPPVPVEVSKSSPNSFGFFFVFFFASFPRTAPPTSPEKDTAACCPLAVSSYRPKLIHPGSPQTPASRRHATGAGGGGGERRAAPARRGTRSEGGGGKGGKGVE